MQQSILILGHRGFIGHHTVDWFLKNKWFVIGVSRHSLNYNHPNLIEFNLDLHTDLGIKELSAIIEKFNCNTVLNLVWDVAANCHSALTSFDSQYDALRIARAYVDAKISGNKNLIAAGTNAEYLTHYNYKLFEDADECIGPDSIYGECKYSTYRILKKLCRDNDIAFKWPRIFSAFGEGMRPTCFMPALIKAISTRQPYEIKNGSAFTHFTPIEVVAEDLYHLIADNNNVTTNAVNISSMMGLFVTDVANILIDNLDSTFKPMLTIKSNIFICQAPSLEKHNQYISSTGVTRDTFPYVKRMLKYI